MNADKPYDRFILEQLAGDELADANTETVIATGFSRVGPWDAERGASVQKSEVIAERFNELDDMVSTTSQVFLALTMGCARCHDHKFDPLTSRDYYSMVAIFSPLQRSRKGRAELSRPAVPPRVLHRLSQKKTKPGGKQSGQQIPQGYFLFEASPKAAVTHLLKRGNPNTPGPVVPPAVPAALVIKQPTFEKPDRFTSRRRISLARWIADANNPLTSRVIVNRVWQHHFGYGLVRSANDFGFRGTKPTHPKLLDWLADWFAHDAKFSLKRLHRLIMTSNTYRMSKRRNKTVADKDPENRLLSHFPYQRLEVEAIRDSMLAVSGQMTNTLYGPGMYPHIPADALRSGYNPKSVWKPFNERDASRRTIYSYIKRTLVVPFLDTFDFCDTTRSAARRNVSTVAPQALELLNGEFVNRQARHFADRLIREAGSDVDRQIRRAYRLALGREPTPDERRTLRRFLTQERRSLIADDKQRNRKTDSSFALPTSKLVLWLDAQRGVERNKQGIVTRWADQSGRRHHAAPHGTPRRSATGLGGKPTVLFDGKQDWLSIAGAVLTSQQFSIFAVVNDRGKSAAHRNLFGNWNGGKGNSSSSVFLGTTQSAGGGRRVRLSDDYADTRLRLKNPERGFVLTAISEAGNARVFQNAVELGNKGVSLSKRRLDTAWMVGRQGAAGEFWQGEISELLVYDTALNRSERGRVWRYLGRKYGLSQQFTGKPLTPAEAHRRALIQMCRVIFNLNEFVYTD